MRSMRVNANLAGLILLMLLSLLPRFVTAAQKPRMTVVRYFQTDNRYTYRIALLHLALQETAATDGPFQLIGEDETVTQARGERQLQQGKIDVAFLPANRQREQRFQAIRIPILRGFLGYRLLLVKREALPQFVQIKTLAQLQHLTAGFDSQWADLGILKANHLPVIAASRYSSLFLMLAAGRFDYFPRGANEAWNELAARPALAEHIVVEPHLALYYPYPVYFFTNRQNIALAHRIQRGLEMALADGQFRKLFFAYNGANVKQTNITHRNVIVLENPFLAPSTPPIDTHWWLPDKTPRSLGPHHQQP